MEHGNSVRKPLLKQADGLGRERDFRYKHNRLPTGGEAALDGVHIHLGLAAAGDPVQQQRSAALLHCQSNGFHRANLCVVERNLLVLRNVAHVRAAEGHMTAFD